MSLDSLMEGLSSLSDVGDCVARVEHLLKELKLLEEQAQVSLACPTGRLSSSADVLKWVTFFIFFLFSRRPWRRLNSTPYMVSS